MNENRKVATENTYNFLLKSENRKLLFYFPRRPANHILIDWFLIFIRGSYQQIPVFLYSPYILSDNDIFPLYCGKYGNFYIRQIGSTSFQDEV